MLFNYYKVTVLHLHFFQLISLNMKGSLTSLAALLVEGTTILTMPNSFKEAFLLLFSYYGLERMEGIVIQSKSLRELGSL